jgi:L-phenylalanine/L-methionine N-acetyltransferase
VTTEAIMSTDVKIRAFEPEDIDEFTDVMNQPRVIWGTVQAPYASVAGWREKSAGFKPALRIVAVLDNRVVGSASLERYANPRRAHAGTIGMAVHDAYVGRGCGAALLHAIVDQADLWLNLRRIELTAWADNQRAIALYERFGFVREGMARDHGFRDGAYVDTLFMARVRA